MKKYFVRSLFLLIMFFSVNSVVYANNTLKLDINGSDVSNNYIMVPGRMLVNFGALGKLTNIKWQFVKNSELIIITRTDTKEKITIKIGDSFLYKNGTQIKLDVPVTCYKNRVYVPIRAIAEAVGAKLFFLNGTVFIRSVDSNILNDTKNMDLSIARTAICKLQRYPLTTLPRVHPDDSGEPFMGFEYYFLEGEVNRFFEYNDYYKQLTFYEVKDGVAWAEWVGQINQEVSEKSNVNNTVTKLAGPISKEAGKRPVISKRVYFFLQNNLSGQYLYGYIDPDGTKVQLKDTNLLNLIGNYSTQMYITKIQNEKRVVSIPLCKNFC